MLTMLDMLPYLRVLPWVAVETAPATVWSMYHEKEGSVHPSGCFTVLHPASLACQVGLLQCTLSSLLLLARQAHIFYIPARPSSDTCLTTLCRLTPGTRIAAVQYGPVMQARHQGGTSDTGQAGQHSHGVCQIVQQHTRLHTALHCHRLLILVQHNGEAFFGSLLCKPA